MPRATKSKVTEILDYFKTSSMEVAQITFDLVKDAMADRKGRGDKIRSAKAKSGAATGPVGVANAAVAAATDSAAPGAPAPAKKKGWPAGKKRGKGKKGAAAQAAPVADADAVQQASDPSLFASDAVHDDPGQAVEHEAGEYDPGDAEQADI